MHEWVIVQYECLQVDQASHLGWQTIQLIVTQVQIQQVCQVDEQLVGDGVDGVVAQIQHQHVPAVLQIPGDLRQQIVAQVLKEKKGKAWEKGNHIVFLVNPNCTAKSFFSQTVIFLNEMNKRAKSALKCELYM